MSGFYTPAREDFTLKSKRLVVPVVSVANLAQLAADLLICTLGLERIGYLDDAHLVPAVGARDQPLYGGQSYKGGITTSLEVFGRPDLDVVVMQQRSPVLKLYKSEFVESMSKWIKESQFKSVLYLSGLDPSNRKDSQMLTPTYHLLPKDNTFVQASSSFDLSSIPAFDLSSTLSQMESLRLDNSAFQPSPSQPRLPGAGLTTRLLNSDILSASLISRIGIFQYVMEGDNRTDAHLLARHALKALKLPIKNTSELREPPSWGGLFGELQDQTIFG